MALIVLIFVIKEVGRIQRFVAVKLEDGAMKLVGAGFGDDVDDSARKTSVFGTGDEAELLALTLP